MQVNMWLVDAFTKTPLTGNPAGVIPDARGLTDEQMQSIAAEIHASETAFVFPSKSGQADFTIRYFTPQQEVDLCGHATIGAICGLAWSGQLELKGDQARCAIETKVGILPIQFGRDQHGVYASMQQDAPKFRLEQIDVPFIADILGIHSSDLDLSLPMGYSYTGLWDFFVGVHSLQVINRLSPNFARMEAWNKRNNVVSTHVYTTDCVDTNNDFHCRDFAPAVGILEDPATGTATGAMLALLHKKGVVQSNVPYRFEQGYEIGRPSLLTSRIETHLRGASRVHVGGHAVVTLEGVLHL